MTKKDYELIASSLNYCKPSKIAKPKGFEDRFFTWKGIVYDMTMNLASKNPRFQKDKFLKACGVEVEHKHEWSRKMEGGYQWCLTCEATKDNCGGIL